MSYENLLHLIEDMNGLIFNFKAIEVMSIVEAETLASLAPEVQLLPPPPDCVWVAVTFCGANASPSTRLRPSARSYFLLSERQLQELKEHFCHTDSYTRKRVEAWKANDAKLAFIAETASY